MKEAGRHIDKVLKEKLGNHSLPVTEQDWTEFQSLFRKQRRKRRGMIWVISICLISIAGLGIWYMESGAPSGTKTATEEQDRKNTAAAPEELNNGSPGQSGKSGNTSGEPKQELNSQSDEIAGRTPAKVQQPEPQPQPQPKSQQNTPAQPKQDLPSNGSNPSNGTNNGAPGEGRVQPGGTTPGADPVVNRRPSLPAPFIAGMPFHIPSFHPRENKPDYLAAYKVEDSSRNNGILKKPFEKRKLGPALAFGMVYGFGNPSLSLPSHDTNYVHKEFDEVMKNTAKENSVFRVYAKYEHRLKLGVELTGGLEFSSTVQKQQYNFTLREIPYFHMNGTIAGYYTPTNTYSTQFESKHQIFSARVPISVGYSHFFGPDFRVGARVQGTFGFNWSSASFSGLNPAKMIEEKSPAQTNPYSLSYGGGLFGEYFYLEKWSLRGSFDWTGQNGQYKKKTPYNLNNRFYELNLAIVRYL